MSKSPIHIIAAAALVNGNIYRGNELAFSGTKNDPAGFLLETYNHLELNYPKFYKMDLLSKLGWLNAEILLQGNDWIKSYKPEEISLVFCNSQASLDTDLKYFQTVQDFASPALFVYTLPNIVTGEISIRHRFKGENAFFIFPDFDAAFLEHYVSGMIETQATKLCLCGWTDILHDQYVSVMFLVSAGDHKALGSFDRQNLENYYNRVSDKHEQ